MQNTIWSVSQISFLYFKFEEYHLTKDHGDIPSTFPACRIQSDHTSWRSHIYISKLQDTIWPNIMEISHLYFQIAGHNPTKHHGDIPSIFPACRIQYDQTSWKSHIYISRLQHTIWPNIMDISHLYYQIAGYNLTIHHWDLTYIYPDCRINLTKHHGDLTSIFFSDCMIQSDQATWISPIYISSLQDTFWPNQPGPAVWESVISKLPYVTPSQYKQAEVWRCVTRAVSFNP